MPLLMNFFSLCNKPTLFINSVVHVLTIRNDGLMVKKWRYLFLFLLLKPNTYSNFSYPKPSKNLFISHTIHLYKVVMSFDRLRTYKKLYRASIFSSWRCLFTFYYLPSYVLSCVRPWGIVPDIALYEVRRRSYVILSGMTLSDRKWRLSGPEKRFFAFRKYMQPANHSRKGGIGRGHFSQVKRGFYLMTWCEGRGGANFPKLSMWRIIA